MAVLDPSQDSHKKEVTQVEQKKKLLFVVHRYAPFPGGSENYVRDMAENAYLRGHTVAVFAGEHQGPHNGIFVTSDPDILRHSWDLIIVHGGDVGVQNYVLQQADKLGGPVLYLLILPSHSAVCVGALHKAKYLGCSTLADWRHVGSYNATAKAVRVRHGIHVAQSVGTPGFREVFNINTKYMFMSAGGFWPNKGFSELVDTFNRADRTDVTLVLTGYDNRHGIMPPDSKYVRSLILTDREDMLSALRDADLYILNSISEGFGLVLLEAMLNGTPWAARCIAGAETMQEFGKMYTTQLELEQYLRDFKGERDMIIKAGQQYVLGTHQIAHTIDDILRILK